MKAMAAGGRGRDFAGDITAFDPRVKPAVMERCQIGDNGYEGYRRASSCSSNRKKMCCMNGCTEMIRCGRWACRTLRRSLRLIR